MSNEQREARKIAEGICLRGCFEADADSVEDLVPQPAESGEAVRAV